MTNRTKAILKMALSQNSDKLIDKFGCCFDSGFERGKENIPTESVYDKVGRYLTTLGHPVDDFEFEEDNQEITKTYASLQPVEFTHNKVNFHEFVDSNNHNSLGDKSVQVISHYVIKPNRLDYSGNVEGNVKNELVNVDNDSHTKEKKSELSSTNTHCQKDQSINVGNDSYTEESKSEMSSSTTHCQEDQVLQVNKEVDVSRRNRGIWDRKNMCPFCFMEHTHFARHIERKHADEPRVRKILSHPVGSIERKELWNCLRKEGNFALFKETKKVIAVRRPTENESRKNAKTFDDFAVCSACTGVYKKKTLSRHAKSCSYRLTEDQKRGRLYALTQSQTFLAAARCQNDFLLKSRLKNEVFNIMKADKISEVAKNDLLICLFGESHLKKHKRPQIATVTSNKMRELARLLISLKDIVALKGDDKDRNDGSIIQVKNLMQVMKPEFFDNLVAASKVIAGYDPETKTFKAASLALHMGTSLKQLCNIIHRHIIKKSKLFVLKDPELELKNIKHLHKLLEDHWATEISSLALKDMNEKHWEKPQIIPVTNDIIKFNEYVKREVEDSSNLLTQMIEKVKKDILYDKQTFLSNYKRLAKSVMALVLILNRKRIGEIQYLKMSTYLKDFSDPNTQEELFECLSTSEKLLCTNFKRVVSGGKGSRPVPILFSPFLQQKIDLLLTVRKMIQEIPASNEYLFANLDSSKGWFHGVSVIRSFASACGALNTSSLTSTKFRKQTATILQIMNINENDMEQLANFMGHTKKTHEEWYRLPQDVYQTAKMAKLLTMIDQGKAYLYKGKGLDDITIDETDVLEVEEQKLAVSRKEHIESVTTNKSKTCNETTISRSKGTINRETQDLNSDSDEHSIVEEDAVINKRTKLKPVGNRKKWSKEEKDIMLKYFKHFIQHKRPPKKHEVEEFKLKKTEVFGTMDWVRIKTFVYNQYKDN